MFKKISVAFIAITSALGIQYSRPPVFDQSVQITQVSASPTPIQSVNPFDRPEIKLGEIIDATKDETLILVSSVSSGNAVIASDCFKDAVLNAKFTETNGLSNQQIYELISAKPVNVAVKMFTGSFAQNYIYRTMGYDIGDGVAYMNRHFVKDAKTMFSVIVHEAEGHGNGFHHYGTKSTSVPYQFNDFFAECSK